jgi:hypothetical protein
MTAHLVTIEREKRAVAHAKHEQERNERRARKAARREAKAKQQPLLALMPPEPPTDEESKLIADAEVVAAPSTSSSDSNNNDVPLVPQLSSSINTNVNSKQAPLSLASSSSPSAPSSTIGDRKGTKRAAPNPTTPNMNISSTSSSLLRQSPVRVTPADTKPSMSKNGSDGSKTKKQKKTNGPRVDPLASFMAAAQAREQELAKDRKWWAA